MLLKEDEEEIGGVDENVLLGLFATSGLGGFDLVARLAKACGALFFMLFNCLADLILYSLLALHFLEIYFACVCVSIVSYILSFFFIFLPVLYVNYFKDFIFLPVLCLNPCQRIYHFDCCVCFNYFKDFLVLNFCLCCVSFVCYVCYFFLIFACVVPGVRWLFNF